MQKTLSFLVLLCSLVSCNSEGENNSTDEDTSAAETIVLPDDQVAWRADYDTATGDMILRKRESVVINEEVTTPEIIIEGINISWPDIQMVYEKVSGDTVFVKIPNSQYLTQQMGSSGPPGYFALATYSLTELKGIRYVRFDFEEGDHAMPGTFSRDNFRSFIR
ncbi:MAG TPA: hypothetical protein PKC69_06670 [Chitinophagaceae bacterium]|nr:hypothetical protein [Chitinophagaceae bacterium]